MQKFLKITKFRDEKSTDCALESWHKVGAFLENSSKTREELKFWELLILKSEVVEKFWNLEGNGLDNGRYNLWKCCQQTPKKGRNWTVWKIRNANLRGHFGLNAWNLAQKTFLKMLFCIQNSEIPRREKSFVDQQKCCFVEKNESLSKIIVRKIFVLQWVCEHFAKNREKIVKKIRTKMLWIQFRKGNELMLSPVWLCFPKK